MTGRLPFRRTIKFKLTVAALIPLFIGITICWVIGVAILTTRVAGQAQEKVGNDLNAAREVLNGDLLQVRDVIRFTAAAPYTVKHVVSRHRDELAALTVPLLRSEQLDLLTVTDPVGTVLFRAGNPAAHGDSRAPDPFVARAVKGEITAGYHILRRRELEQEGAELAGRAVVPLRTADGAADPAGAASSGLFLMVAAPVRDAAGNIVGVLYGGRLLNHRNAIVDRIRDTIGGDTASPDHGTGTATIFLDGIRIATNVPGAGGDRAVGTRMSDEVYNTVLLKGERWLGRAFVVNTRYFAAYEPVMSLAGVPIGALYVGMQERPYTHLKVRLGLIYSCVLLLGTLIGLAVSGSVSTRLARPVRELERLARRFATGERGLHARVEGDDEIGSLAAEFNRMTDALTRQEEEIRSFNRNLEQKVLERTMELEEKNRLLVAAQDELIRTAKLADLGVLAAGVAHEINNPMAIIRGNAELLQMSLLPGHADHEEVDTIVQQVARVERIVANLLRFAHQERKHLTAVRLDTLLDGIMKQIGHQVPLADILVVRGYDPALPPVEGDHDQLLQVFTNLVLNAVQAMKGSGTLTLAAHRGPGEDTVTVAVGDTGKGIPPEEMERIFTPFFTTRSRGTGLGLSVSYGIVSDHGGRIEVDSAVRQGTTFRVIMPLRQPVGHDDGTPGDSVYTG